MGNQISLFCLRNCIADAAFALFLPAAALLCPAQAAAPAPVQVHLTGTDLAEFSVSFSDGTEDQVEIHWQVDLLFIPQNLLTSGNFAISHQATFSGSFHITGRDDRRSADGQILNTISFDVTRQISAPSPFPVETSFNLGDGTLASLQFDLTSSSTPRVYRLNYAPGVGASTIWTRLPPPFGYREDVEANPITLTAVTLNAAASLTGRVMDAKTQQPLSGALVQIGNAVRTTDANGAFIVDQLAPGLLTLHINKPGYRTYDLIATMLAFISVEMDFKLEPDVPDAFTATIELTPATRPIMPGQGREAMLSFQNTTSQGFGSTMQAEVYLSETKEHGSGAVLLGGDTFIVHVPANDAFVRNIPITIPLADQLPKTGAGARYLVCVLTDLLPDANSIKLASNPVVSDAFWLGSIVNIVTHGFGSDMNVPGIGRVTLIPNFMAPWIRLQHKLDHPGIAESNLFAGSISTYVAQWDSSDGWVQAVGFWILARILERTDAVLLAPVADDMSKASLLVAYRYALDAAFAIRNSRADGLLQSPQFSQFGYQIIHLIGHSRGGAVNAFLAHLLSQQGYRIEQYTALDGYSGDWPMPSDFFADIDLVSEVQRASIARSVNYEVQDGLAEVLYEAIEPYLANAFEFYFHQPFAGVSDVAKKIISVFADWRAPDRPSPPFENHLITGAGDKPRSNHLNVPDLYVDSDTRDASNQYIFDNYLGAKLGKHFIGSSQSRFLVPENFASKQQSVPNAAVGSANFGDFVDGTFEMLGALDKQIANATFPHSTDDTIRVLIALLRDSPRLFNTVWRTVGDVSLIATNGNSLVELRQTTNTALGQLIIFNSAAASVEFDLSVVASGSSNSLQVMFETNLLQQIALTNSRFNNRLSVPLQNLSGPGEVTFRLNSPGETAETPAVIRLDNLAIIYSRPRITHVQAFTGSGVRFSVEGTVGTRYAVEISNDLTNWRQSTTLQNQTGTVEFSESQFPAVQQRFYRIRVLP